MKQKSSSDVITILPVYCYTPKPVPKLDKDGNVMGFETPLVVPCTLAASDTLRVKTHCNELGLSADPNNVTGFRRTLDIINLNRNLIGSGIVKFGCDDLEVMQQAETYVKSIKDYSK